MANQPKSAWSQYYKNEQQPYPHILPPYAKHPCRDCPANYPGCTDKCTSPQLYDDQLRADGRPNSIIDHSTSKDNSIRHHGLFEGCSKKAQGI